MGLTCNKLQSENTTSKSLKTTETWAKSGGYVFRPAFQNEISESSYEKIQLCYNMNWRKQESSMKRRSSYREIPSIDETFLENFRENIREGVPDRLAREVIRKLFSLYPNDQYWKILKDSFEVILKKGTIPDTFFSVPTFSSITSLEEAVPKFYINSTGIIALKRTLWALHKEFESVNFCPQLPSLISLLLVYMNEEEVFLLCSKLLKDNKTILIQNKEKFGDFVRQTVNGIIRTVLELSERGKELNKIVADVVRKMFIGYFRINCLLRLLVAVLTEGIAFVGNFICAVFNRFLRDERISSLKLQEQVKVFTFSLHDIDSLVAQSYKIKIYEKDQARCWTLFENRSFLDKAASECLGEEMVNHELLDQVEKVTQDKS